LEEITGVCSLLDARVPVLAKQLKLAGGSVVRWLQEKETAMSFVPPDLEVPELLETDRFRIRIPRGAPNALLSSYQARKAGEERFWQCLSLSARQVLPPSGIGRASRSWRPSDNSSMPPGAVVATATPATGA
jgi:hypothetical protein